ncbi:MAG: pyridoxal-phosphate dependent enzyme [Saprospiraceae bacterium]
MPLLPKLTQVPTLADIQATHEAIKPLIHRTPLLQSTSINEIAGAEIYFKCENFQKIGAFKMRGGASAALRLTEAEKSKGVATHSSGNHAQAVARSAQELDISAYIVMPSNAPSIKQAATRGYGAEVILCEPTLQSRESTLEEVVAKTGATFIHPYNDYNVIAGQATAALEILEDTDDLDIIMAPVGGGGLISGTSLTTAYLSPNTKVIGAEPSEVDDAYRSFHSGVLQKNETTNTVADGLRTSLGPKTLGIIRDHVEEIYLVEEQEIIDAMRLTWERMKLIIEPSCAVPLAAVLKYPEVFSGKKIVIIITGGNVDINHLPF